jgi:hypothetical protein
MDAKQERETGDKHKNVCQNTQNRDNISGQNGKRTKVLRKVL